MINDPVNYVRQGALLASAMVLVQQNDHMCPKLKTFKELFTKTMSDKHEDVMVKFGAILAQVCCLDGTCVEVVLSIQKIKSHLISLHYLRSHRYWLLLQNYEEEEYPN